MKTFNFKLSDGFVKKLSDIGENYIKVKHISSDTFDNLEQQFVIKTSYPDGKIISEILSSGAYITPYTREPKIDIDYPIEDCPLTTIEAVKKDDKASYLFEYETLSDILTNVSKKSNDAENKIKLHIDEWKNKVDTLFNEISLWLKPYESNIKTKKEKTLIREEVAGTYEINYLDIIVFDKSSIRLEPIATFIIGGKGRIDIKTNFTINDSYMIILLPIGTDEKWYIIKNRDESSKKEFSQSQLLKLIENAVKPKA